MTINGIGPDPTPIPVNEKTDTPPPAPALPAEAAQVAPSAEHSSGADAYALTLSLLSYLIIPEGAAGKQEAAAKPDSSAAKDHKPGNGSAAKVDIAA